MKWLSFVIAFLCVSFGHALLTVPQNVRAAAIGDVAFTLRWDAVAGADEYDVEVKEAVQSLVIDEDFEGLEDIPAGWIKVGDYVDVITNVSFAHSGTNLCSIPRPDNYLRLPQSIDPSQLTFWARKRDSGNSFTLIVEYSTDLSTWIELDSYVARSDGTGDILNFYQCYTINISNDSYISKYIGFRHTGDTYPIFLDDIQLTAIDLSTPNLSASATTSNAVRLTDLSPETAYIFRVRAINSTETGDYSAWQLVTTLDSSSDTVTGSIINNAPAQMDLPSVGSYSGQTMQITPSTGGDADYSVSVAAVDNGLSYSVSCESDVYLNGTYVITHPGLTATNINVPMGKLTISAQDLGSTSFSIDGFGAKGTIDFSLLFGDDTLPVEMGNMSVSPIGAHAVNLEWLSHSETNLLGYYVWRSETGSLQDARMISPLIQATNSSNGNAYVFQDTNDAPSASYWVEAVEYDGASTYHGPVIYQAPEQGSSAPNILVNELQNIYPNPFNPSATISYSLRDAQSVVIKVYDAKGRLVHSHDEPTKGPGRHQYIWNAKGAGSGVYYVKMRIGEKSFERKLVLMK